MWSTRVTCDHPSSPSEKVNDHPTTTELPWCFSNPAKRQSNQDLVYAMNLKVCFYEPNLAKHEDNWRELRQQLPKRRTPWTTDIRTTIVSIIFIGQFIIIDFILTELLKETSQFFWGEFSPWKQRSLGWDGDVSGNPQGFYDLAACSLLTNFRIKLSGPQTVDNSMKYIKLYIGQTSIFLRIYCTSERDEISLADTCGLCRFSL